MEKDNSKIHKNGFYSPTLGTLTLEKVLEEIAVFVDSDGQSYYRLVIGSDSHIKHVEGKSQTDFVTAIVIHRIGKGARYFWSKDRVPRTPSLREKIYTETLRSLTTAQEVLPKLQNKLSPDKYELEIHIDVGLKGPTREMIKEVVGMVNGNGFKVKTKPESWAASSVADKHT